MNRRDALKALAAAPIVGRLPASEALAHKKERWEEIMRITCKCFVEKRRIRLTFAPSTVERWMSEIARVEQEMK